jgi:hypothetical protein
MNEDHFEINYLRFDFSFVGIHLKKKNKNKLINSNENSLKK